MIGDVFGDFIRNLPPGLIGMMCAPGILFLVMVGIMIFRRRMLAQKQTAQAAATPGFVEAPPADPPMMDMPELSAMDDMAMGDMPDLDLLLTGADPEQIPEPVVPAPTVRKVPDGVQRVSLNTGASTEARELITVLRDERDGRLMVQLGNTTYRTLVDAPDAKKQFVKIMKELSSVVIQPDEDAPQPMPDAQPVEPEPATPEPVSLGSLIQPSEDEQAVETPVQEKAKPVQPIKSQTPPPVTKDGSMPGDLPSFRLADNEPDVKRGGLFGRRTKVEHKPVPTVNIADAIEAYLQHKLQHTPEYDGPQLHVRSSADGGVRIQVGETFYEAVSDVDDPAIREFLQTTIQEWQSRQ